MNKAHYDTALVQCREYECGLVQLLCVVLMCPQVTPNLQVTCEFFTS